MANHISQTEQSAFTWTGPYGSGKSSLVVALSSLLSGKKSPYELKQKMCLDKNFPIPSEKHCR